MISSDKDKLLVWRGKNILVRDGVRPSTVVVKGGKVTQVLEGLVEVEGATSVAEVLDDQVLMPGIVDSHVHINEPGRTDWEGFSTATRAAAAGGVTTLVDMPLNSLPPTTTGENLRIKSEAARGQCWVDVGFWGGVIPGNSGNLKEMVTMGVPGFKCFLIHSGVDEFPAVNKKQAEEALKNLKGTGATLLFHAECEVDVVGNNGDPADYSTFLDSRPPLMETTAIELVVNLCRSSKVPCHIVHLSAVEALPLIQAAKAEGLPLTVETCHHYLNLVAEEIPSRATQFKCCPPVRGRANQEALWAAVVDGDIDMVVSDHSPCTPDLKRPGVKDFMDSWGGISSLQYGLSLFWGQATRRGLSFVDLNRLMCLHPAKLAGLSKRKGKLEEGFDADFVIWAPNEEHVVDVGGIQHKNKITPYLGMTLQGVVHSTVLGGKVIFNKKNGFLGEPVGKLLLNGNPEL